MLPRAMRADSTRTLRDSPAAGWPVAWLMTCIWGLSGAKHETVAPARLRWMSTLTDSWISLPSKTPQPERTTAALIMALASQFVGLGLGRAGSSVGQPGRFPTPGSGIG